MNPDLWYSCTSPRQMIDWLGDNADEKRLITTANITRQLWDARTVAYNWRQQGENHADWLLALGDSYDCGRVANDACNILRCLFPNPHIARERVECPRCCNECGSHHPKENRQFYHCPVCDNHGTIESPMIDPRWLSSTVIELANTIRGSGPNGDWPSGGDWTHSPPRPELMPALADALQDAGCDNDEVVEHCMSDGPHVAGCFVISEILKVVA